MSDELAKNLQEQANIEDEKPKKKFNFNFQQAAAKPFTPSSPLGNTFQPGASSRYAYQDFSNYAKPQPEQDPSHFSAPQQSAQQSVTLDQYQNKTSGASLSTRGANKGKNVLTLGKKPEHKEAKVITVGAKSALTETKASSPSSATSLAPASASSTEQTKEPKIPAKEPPKPSHAEAKACEKASASVAVDSEAIIKEQEQLDQEVVQDMFGDAEALKEHMSIIFMGHVDAGKSTMGGNLLYLTGSVDKRTIDKYEREAQDAGRQGWYLSWVMDTNKEERNEGKTIEVGRATFETEKRRYTILDAPGHKMYVPSMIGGASQADAGILVISARAGEYETGFEKGGQTREHAVLAKTQGVDRMVVVVNKMDDPTVNWSKERFDECTSKLAVFLKATGYTNVTYMPVSGFTGAGLKDPVPKADAPWYSGPSLIEWLESVPLENRKIGAPFMLPVSSKAKDLGTVVEGKIESGALKKGASLLMMPNRQSVEVSTIFDESEQEINGAVVGDQVRLKLKGIDEEEIQIGYVLTSSKNPVKAVSRFEAQIAIVDIKSILTTGFSCVMHVHTAVEEVVFSQLLHKLEKGTNRKSKKAPAFAKKGMKIIAILETPSPVCVEEFAKTPQLGRFTLRDQGQTIAIGKVTKILD